MVCATPIYRGKKKGQLATGTTAGYNRHRRAGEPSCTPCLEAATANARAWAHANPEAQRKSERAWRLANPDKIRAKHLRNFNLSPEQFNSILESQDGKCAICGADSGPRGLHIDHDHTCCDFRGSCGRCVRGLLCQRCNFRLAIVEDEGFTHAAALYLRSYS